MPPPASWVGRARIKGYTKLQRMAMLTFSLIGLQPVSLSLSHPVQTLTAGDRFTWAVEMTCIHTFPPAAGRFDSWHLCRLGAASLEAGSGEESDFARVDRSSALGLDCAAGCGSLVGFFAAEVGEEEAVYAVLLCLGGFFPCRPCVGVGDC